MAFHEVKELFSCNQCDFDSEIELELKDHMKKNIHNCVTQNKTLAEPDMIKCHLCEYTVYKEKDMDNHLVHNHGFIFCKKCEYMSDDKELIRKHYFKHTGDNVFVCGICEFETTRRSMLEDHKEAKHPKENMWWNEYQKQDHYCTKCENTFKNLFVKRYHLCTKKKE